MRGNPGVPEIDTHPTARKCDNRWSWACVVSDDKLPLDPLTLHECVWFSSIFFHNVLFWGVQQCFPSRCRLPLTTWPCFSRATPWHISRQRDFPHMLSRRQVSDSAGERIKCVPKLSPNRQRSVALEPFAPDHMCSGAREKGADGTPSSCRGLPEGTVRAASGVDNLCSLMRYLHDVWSASDFGYASHARTPWEDTVATLKSSKHKEGDRMNTQGRSNDTAQRIH